MKQMDADQTPTLLDYQYAALKYAQADDEEIVAYCNSSESTVFAVMCNHCSDQAVAADFALLGLSLFRDLFTSPRTSYTDVTLAADGESEQRAASPAMGMHFCNIRRSPPRRVSSPRERVQKMYTEDAQPDNWLLLYIDSERMLVAGRGRFVFYVDGMPDEACIFSEDNALFVREYRIPTATTISVVVTFTKRELNRERTELLLQTARDLRTSTDALAEALVSQLVKDQNFYVLTMLVHKRLAETTTSLGDSDSGSSCSDEQQQQRWGTSSSSRNNSPRKPTLRVIDSDTCKIEKVQRSIRRRQILWNEASSGSLSESPP